MEIDLFAALDHEGAEITVDQELELCDLSLSDGGPDFPYPIRVRARIVNRGGALDLRGEASGSFHVQCARCTKDLTKAFCFPLQETLVPQRNDSPNREDDAIVFSGTRVDLSEIVAGNLIVNLSLKYLCSEDCKGLCPVCGADRNVAPCQCDPHETDPRLAGLKNFFDE